jgi:hypothetical protein
LATTSPNAKIAKFAPIAQMRFEVSEDTPVLSIKIINPPAEFGSQERSENFLAFVFCSSLIDIGEASNPHRRVTKFVPNLPIILIG